MSEQNKETTRAWAQVIIPVVLSALGQLVVVLNQINGLDKSVALANQSLSQSIEDTKDLRVRMGMINDRVMRLQFEEAKLNSIMVRMDAFDARLIAMKAEAALMQEQARKK